jgi:hypothetical protein
LYRNGPRSRRHQAKSGLVQFSLTVACHAGNADDLARLNRKRDTV